MDFNDAPPGEGREKHHIAAIKATQKAGVEHVYYTSLAFTSDSGAGVMRAHLRTEEFLRSLEGMKYKIIREGLYNESWPLYLGYYYDLKGDDRKEILVAGDGPVSWTSIADLGYATALVLAEALRRYEGKTFYLSSPTTKTLKDVSAIVSEIKGREIGLMIVSRAEYEKFYTEMGRDRASVEWWSSTYAALGHDECHIEDGTLGDLFSVTGKEPKPIAETVNEMIGS